MTNRRVVPEAHGLGVIKYNEQRGRIGQKLRSQGQAGGPKNGHGKKT
jgi:hypothetical protein